jgi:S-formylglutathione hydrolase FrmB
MTTALGTGVAVDAHDVVSAANRRRFAVWSWRPEGDGPFPLLVLLHGVYDSGGHGWWLRAREHEQVAALVDSGELATPPVILMPTDTGAEFGSAYADWADGTTSAETVVASELLSWAETAFPLDGTRWVTGLSMGGYGALLLALRHPGVFASASSTSGFFTPGVLSKYGPDFAGRIWGDPQRMLEHDVTALLESADRRRGLRLAFDCGTDDQHLAANRRLHEQLTAAGVPHGYAEHAGGHDWGYWRAHVTDHVRFHAGLPGPLSDRTTDTHTGEEVTL